MSLRGHKLFQATDRNRHFIEEQINAANEFRLRDRAANCLHTRKTHMLSPKSQGDRCVEAGPLGGDRLGGRSPRDGTGAS